MTLSDYSELKQQVVLAVSCRDSYSKFLQTIRDYFKNGINSVRRFEEIQTIEQLLQVLELRDLLSENNVGPLKIIASELKNVDLLSKICEYEKTHVPRQYVNYYASAANKSHSTECFINTSTPLDESICDKKKERIYLTVTEQIGSAWKDLARSLRIQECVIDEIDANNKTMASKASKMLKRFDSRADRQKWHFVLCEALDRVRRKELRHTVQEIMMMNI